MNGLGAQVRYAFYTAVHPFKGFWDIKHERRGSLKIANSLLAAFVLVSVAGGLYSGFIFNPYGGVEYNVLTNVAGLLLVYLLWCVANWCLTSLFDGEGRFRDICIYTSYALLPITLAKLVLIPLSWSLAVEEAAFYNMIYAIGLLWSAFLLAAGTITTHQYSLSKTLVIVVATLLGMCIIAYIMLLFFNLLQQILGFFLVCGEELGQRLG